MVITPSRTSAKTRSTKTDQAPGPEAKRARLVQPLRPESVLIDVQRIVRHPKNRRPTPDAVAKIAASMKELGQIDDVVVRPLGDDLATCELQMVSGETRWLAAIENGEPWISGRIERMTDAEALQKLAAANAERSDLNPIERAQLLAELTKPVEEGGGGMTQEQAGKMFRGEKGEPLSRPAVSNALRLLVAPQAVRELVADGTLPETYVRPLLPLLEGPLGKETAKAILKQSKGDTGRYSRDEFARQVGWDVTRDLPSVDARRSDWVATSEYTLNDIVKAKGKGPQAFNVTDANRDELAIVDVNGQRKVASSVEAYRRYNLDAAQDLLEKLKKKAKGGKAGGSKGPAGPQKTEAEKAAEAKVRLQHRLDDLAVDLRCDAASRAVKVDPNLSALIGVWFMTGVEETDWMLARRVCEALLGEACRKKDAAEIQYAEETGAAAAVARQQTLAARLLYEPGGEDHRIFDRVAEAVLHATGQAESWLETAWLDDRAVSQTHLNAYLAAHDTEPLRKLLQKCKLRPNPKDKKGDLITLAMDNLAAIPLPPEYRLAEPKGKKGAR